ncbi:MAG: hypothetical protein AB7U93_08100 [Deferribacterales bacterium]
MLLRDAIKKVIKDAKLDEEEKLYKIMHLIDYDEEMYKAHKPYFDVPKSIIYFLLENNNISVDPKYTFSMEKLRTVELLLSHPKVLDPVFKKIKPEKRKILTNHNNKPKWERHIYTRFANIAPEETLYYKHIEKEVEDFYNFHHIPSIKKAFHNARDLHYKRRKKFLAKKEL